MRLAGCSDREERRLYLPFFMLYLAYLLSFVDRSILPVVLAFVGPEFKMGELQTGIVLSSFYLGYVLAQSPGGRLADRIGPRPVVIGCLVSWSIFTLLTGCIGSFGSLVVIRFLFGASVGAFPGAGLKTVAELFEPPQRPRMASLLLSAVYVGSMLGPLVGVPLVSWVGWRLSFAALGLLGLTLAACHGAVPGAKPVAHEIEARVTSLGAQLRSPRLWQLMTAWFGVNCVTKGLESWLPIYLLEVRQVQFSHVALVLSIPNLVGGLVMVLCSVLGTRMEGYSKFGLVMATVLIGVATHLLLSLDATESLHPYISLLILSGIYGLKALALSIVISLAMTMFPRGALGFSVSAIATSGQLAGLLSPAAIGAVLASSNSYPVAFDILAVGAVITAMSVFTITREPYSGVAKESGSS